VLYAHPWQVEHLKDRYPFLTDAGETAPGRPLMSLRTVALPTAHIKTAVDVQMTSAVRTVSPAAVTNGPRLSALLAGLTADLPITVLAETAGGAVTVDGEPQRHLAYLARQAPELADGEMAVPLAAVAASPLLRETIDDPDEWWALLSDRLIAPLVTLLDRGVALEAHGQNTLVVVRNRLPHRFLYRDFGGVRVRGEHHLKGDIPTDDPQELRTKLAASALGNAAADLIAAFTRHFGADPQKLWARTAAAIRSTGTPDAKHLLSDPLPVKATTAMRLATDPLDDIWAYLDNPLAAHA
jgi:siderophore synthetase component